MKEQKEAILRQYFGYTAFRTGQAELIDQILDGRDVLGIMPTGAGKSICYQVPALLLPGMTLVVSPLISLMQDQVAALRDAGISAALLNSSLTAQEYYETLASAARGAYKILYVAPERLLTPDFLSLSERAQISMITVDEAHCVSQWGQDFRPSYLQIVSFLQQLPTRPIVSAFTATATAEVRTDIASMLRLQTPFTLTTGFDRTNLYFAVEAPKDKRAALIAHIRQHTEQCGIVYCISRRLVEEVCALLCDAGFAATRYHAGLSDMERHENQDAFLYDRVQIMVATNAFGMGIDKSNVSFVIHYNMPKNLESYYQEAGRAGRDGEPADCILLYSPQDIRTNQFLIDKSTGLSEQDPENRQAVRERDLLRLKEMTFYCRSTACLRAYILRYFGDSASDYCGHCSTCNANYETVDVTIEAQKILSCIYRLWERGQSFGIAMVAAILRGSKAERIRKNNLETLSTYGLMHDCTETRVRNIIHFLLEEGYLKLEDGEFPVLALTGQARQILFAKQPVTMKLVREQELPASSKADAQLSEMDYALFAALKTLRNKIAATAGLPAYIVFQDASLRDMCIKKPRSQTEFATVSGVGAKKLERYGDAFLEVIASHC